LYFSEIDHLSLITLSPTHIFRRVFSLTIAETFRNSLIIIHDVVGFVKMSSEKARCLSNNFRLLHFGGCSTVYLER